MSLQKDSVTETSAFRSILKYYDNKQYKKCIKHCDNLLKKCPHHAETLAIKAICLSNLGSIDGIDLCKQSVKTNIKSAFCWHILGLIHKIDRNHDEAQKCFRNSLRLDPENLTVLKDLGSSLTQTRDYSKLTECRRQVLALRPSFSAHWIGLILAHFLNEEFSLSLELLELFMSMHASESSSVHNDELLLFKTIILQHLKSHESYERVVAELSIKRSFPSLGSSSLCRSVVNVSSFSHEHSEVQNALRGGDYLKAISLLESDNGSDKYQKCELFKYKLRVGDVTSAMEIIESFSKGCGFQFSKDLAEMQNIWVYLELGHSNFRKRNIEDAAKNYHCILRMFEEFIEDQYDFHNYIYRRCTIDSYLRMINCLDNIYYEKNCQWSARRLFLFEIAQFSSAVNDLSYSFSQLNFADAKDKLTYYAFKFLQSSHTSPQLLGTIAEYFILKGHKYAAHKCLLILKNCLYSSACLQWLNHLLRKKFDFNSEVTDGTETCRTINDLVFIGLLASEKECNVDSLVNVKEFLFDDSLEILDEIIIRFGRKSDQFSFVYKTVLSHFPNSGQTLEKIYSDA